MEWVFIAVGLVLVFAPLIGDWLARRDTAPPPVEPERDWFFTEWKQSNDE